MEFVKILFLCVFSACCYGMVHDVVAGQVSVEYLSVARPKILPVDAAILLGVIWGVVSSWWVGLVLGIPLAVVARCGTGSAKLDANALIPPIQNFLGVLFAVSMTFGLIGYVSARLGVWNDIPTLPHPIAPEKHARFLFAHWAQRAAYVFAFLGGAGFVSYTYRLRKGSDANAPTETASRESHETSSS